MKKLKLFFALFAMLALGVGNAWGAEEEVSLSDGNHANSEITWTAASGNITITQSKGSSSTAVSSNYVDAPRMYKGHILQFAAAEGYGITNISITYSSSYYGTDLYAGTAISNNVVTANTTDLTATYATASDGTHTIATVSAEGASLIALQIPSNASSDYKQLRPTAISITYVKAATSEPTISCGDVNFGTVNSAVINSKEVEVIGENLGTEITASLESGTAFSINGTLTATGGTLTLTVTATTEGTYTDKLTLTSGTTSKEVEVSATVVVCEGEGTEEKPYTVNDVIKLANPAISAWVEGYIVGVMKNNELSTDDLSVNSNLALGATADATENIVPVALPSSTTIRTDLNLVDNSGNLGKKVAVYGLLDTYFSTTGVKNTSNYKWVAADGAPEAPTFTPAAGTYFAAQNVTITAEEGATIYYTIDGTDPTTASTVYSAPIAVGETTTVKAIAVKAEQSSPVASAKYTINLPLTTMDQIFAKATEVGSTATSVQVVMNNWVVTGVKASNAYVTDGTKGFIIYNASHGFVVGDVLSGTVACKVQLYKGASELTELTSDTEGLAVTTGGVVTPVVVNDVTDLKGVNTGSVVKITGQCTVDGTKYYVAGVQLYNSLFTYTNPTAGYNYNVTGVYVQYNDIQEILPRQQEDIEELPGLPTATISIDDITMEIGQEKTIEATITPDAAISTVQYAITSGSEFISLNGTTITANAIGTATITATIAESAGVYYGATKEFTVTVTPLNIAALPFTFDGKQADIANTLGMSHTGVDASDYSSSPHLKFNHAGDNLIVHFDSQAGEFSFVLKQNGSNAGTFTVYESANGEDYTPVWTGGDLGGNGQSKTITPTLAAASRYVKFEYTTKGTSTNYGLGSISIQKPDLRQEAGLAWSAETTSITIGEAFTAPTLSNPNGLTLTCTSDNDALATVTNAGVITLKEGVTGKAVITASYAGNETYKTAEVTTTIFVNPKSDDVVILAKYNGQWYAMKAEYTTSKTDRLAALPVNYVDGKLYNVSEEDKAVITWKLSVNGGNATFQNGTNYLTGGTSTTLSLSETAFDWAFDGSLYLSDSDSRTFIYHKDGYFRNYAKGNPENYPDTYSTLPTVTAPVYATGDAYSRSTTAGKFGTICLPFGSNSYTGATFYEFVGSETGKVYLGSVTTLEAGVPYIFEASANELVVYGNGTMTDKAGYKNGLYGTFNNDTEVAVGNYILKDNKLCQAADICYVNANRAYIVMSEVPTGAPQQMPGRRYIGMSVQGENEATGVEDIFSTDAPVKVIENGQLIIIRDGVKYNVQGQKL